MKILNKYILAAAATVFVAVGLYGQPASPLSEGTDGLFSTDTDNVVSLTGYSNVVFDDFLLTGTYGYVAAGATNTAALVLKTHVINAGGMFRGGDITFGLSYLGTFGGNSDTELSILKTEHKGAKPYTEENNTIPMLHNVKLLAGIPLTDEINLGVRAGVDIGGALNSVAGNGLTLDNISKYKNTNSLSFKPQLAAGAKLGLSNGWVLSPTLDMFVSITNSSGAGQSVYPGEDTGPAISGDGSSYEKKDVMRTYLPGATLGLGIGFPTESAVSMSANVSYSFDVRIQPEKSQYNRWVNSEAAEAEGTHTMRSDSGHSHSLALKFGANASLTEKLKVAGRAQLDASYSHVVDGGTTAETISGNISFEKKKTSKTDTIFVQPVISAGATYQLTETLSWYGGMKFVPVSYTLLKEFQYAESGISFSEADTDTTSHTVRYPILASFGTGFQFKPVEQLLVSASLLFAPANTTVELGTIGDVLSNANLRLSLIWKDVPKN